MARQSRIVVRRRRGPSDLVSPRDFVTWGEQAVSLAALATDGARLSPYAIDFKRRAVMFVMTDGSVDLATSHPFFYEAQRKHAQSTVLASFEEVVDVATSLVLPPHRLIHLYSPGRSGSTVTGKIAGRLPGVQQLSEPDFYSQLVFEAAASAVTGQREFRPVLAALTRLLLHYRLVADPSRPNILVKHRAATLYKAELIRDTAPQSAAIFLYRNPADVIDSYIGAFLRSPLFALPRKLRLDHWLVRGLRFMSSLVTPPLSRFMPLMVEPGVADRNSHGIVEVLALGFHSIMLEASQLQARGFEFSSVLEYEELETDPAAFVRRLASGLGIQADASQIAAALVALHGNAQEGSSIASTGQRTLSARDQQRIVQTLSQFAAPLLSQGGVS